MCRRRGALCQLARELDERVERFRVRERAAAHDAVGLGAEQDALHGHLDHLPRERPRDGGERADLVGDVAR